MLHAFCVRRLLRNKVWLIRRTKRGTPRKWRREGRRRGGISRDAMLRARCCKGTFCRGKSFSQSRGGREGGYSSRSRLHLARHQTPTLHLTPSVSSPVLNPQTPVYIGPQNLCKCADTHTHIHAHKPHGNYLTCVAKCSQCRACTRARSAKWCGPCRPRSLCFASCSPQGEGLELPLEPWRPLESR
jgi:hypothetical protein